MGITQPGTFLQKKRELQNNPQHPNPPSYQNQKTTNAEQKQQDSSVASKTLDIFNNLNKLSELLANITESYTAAVFVADDRNKLLHLAGVHTLSRNLVWNARIPYGHGLIGWVAENRQKVAVSPFEHDSTTLLYYTTEESLKSFMATPVLGNKGELLGVIVCDSKRSYAFAKVTEKLIQDCALQASILIQLSIALSDATQTKTLDPDSLHAVIEQLRQFDEEHALLTAASNIPTTLVDFEALVVMTTAESGIGRGKFYSANRHKRMESRLLELVCSHKKIISSERTVQAPQSDDIKQRTFLSIPFHVLGVEAGSLNLLSKPHESFDATEVAALENIARFLGRELERIRLRDKLVASAETSGFLSWKHFAIQGRILLTESEKQHVPISVLRLRITNLEDIERCVGIEVTTMVMQKIMRLVNQLKRNPSLSCYLYGFQILVVMESTEVQNFISRLRTMLGRTVVSDITTARLDPGIRLGQMLLDGAQVATAEFPSDGASLIELVGKTSQLFHNTTEEVTEGVRANAGKWA